MAAPLVNVNDMTPLLRTKINSLAPQELSKLVEQHRADVIELLLRLSLRDMVAQGHIAPAPEAAVTKPIAKPLALPTKPATKMVYAAKASTSAPAAPSFAAIASAVEYIPPLAKKQPAKESKIIMPPWMTTAGSVKKDDGEDLHLLSVHDAYSYDSGTNTDIRFMLIMATGHILVVGITGDTGHGSYFRMATYKGKTYAVPAGWNEVSCNKGRYRVFTKSGDALAGYGFALDTKPGASPFMWFIVREDGAKFVPVSPKDPAFMAKIGCFLHDGVYAQTRHSLKQREPPVPETAHIVPGGALVVDEVAPAKEQKSANGAIADENAFAALEDTSSDTPNDADEASAAGLTSTCLDSEEEEEAPSAGKKWSD